VRKLYLALFDRSAPLCKFEKNWMLHKILWKMHKNEHMIDA
jgi:hypothetical protein